MDVCGSGLCPLAGPFGLGLPVKPPSGVQEKFQVQPHLRENAHFVKESCDRSLGRVHHIIVPCDDNMTESRYDLY
ncbi:hypothetical protein ACLKA7_007884 [Drosophila subpalustris]